jgi:predicted signal transduction protein with EAL and GGDEF domain
VCSSLQIVTVVNRRPHASIYAGIAHDPQRGVSDGRLMVRSAAAMYAGAAFVGIVEGFTPGGPDFSTVPGFTALGLVPLILMLGHRVPRRAFAGLGLLGVALIADAMAWLDVMVSVCIVATVVRVLTERNDHLVHTLLMEARNDPLTGLLNRRGFDERIAAELVRARRSGRA